MTTSESDEKQPQSGAELPDVLWRDFPKTAPEFEARFATEDDCRAYWSKARWGDTPEHAAVDHPQGPVVRVRGLRPPDEPDVWHIARPDAQAAESLVPRVAPKHLQAYLDEYAFRHNRRRTNGTARIAARVIERLVVHAPRTMRAIIDDTQRTRWFTGKPGVTAPELNA